MYTRLYQYMQTNTIQYHITQLYIDYNIIHIKYTITIIIIIYMRKKKIQNYVINLEEELGEGSFGKVYKGTNLTDKAALAVKVLSKKKINEDEIVKEAYISEIKIMRKLNSPNIVKFIDVVETQNNYYIIQEFCDGGDLRTLLQKRKRFPEEEAVQYINEILTGFLELMSNGVIHRDVKPENILINNKVCKIADFGFAKSTITKSQLHKTLVGTPLYMSPQLLMQEKYTSKCDIWSLGLMFYEFLVGKIPWTGKTEFELVQNIQKIPLKFPKEIHLSENVKSFIEGCLRINENERFSWYDVYKHPLLGGKFTQQISKNETLERRIKYIMNELRIIIHSSNLDLQTLFANMHLTVNSCLKKEEFYALIKKIDKDISNQEFQFLFDKFDNNANGIELEKFKKLLAENNIRLKSKRLKDEKHSNQVDFEKEHHEENISNASHRMEQALINIKERMEQNKLDLKTVFQSYTKKDNEMSLQMFTKLITKVDDGLLDSEIKHIFDRFASKNQKISFENFKHLFSTIKKS